MRDAGKLASPRAVDVGCLSGLPPCLGPAARPWLQECPLFLLEVWRRPSSRPLMAPLTVVLLPPEDPDCRTLIACILA
ncbi:hypothetical protein Celaphus_00000041 [Cervus elaphus hippelaphus]|uniref:Uncharacterized protein n=1 Tax=Cervus elaphus hippelaphus TaxID=46360 RepID=A0A212DAC7_CEREH|nr:hypothetical protein Celaphus_00000041 [Cervus elaphus hippelaphus]